MERKRKSKGYEMFIKITAGIACMCVIICAMPFASAGQDSVRDSIPGLSDVCLYDSEGKSIRAFGGQVQEFTESGETKWYWIGEDAEIEGTEENEGFAPIYHNGIHLYSSKDLYNWEDEGIILKTMNAETDFEEPYFQNLYGDLSDEKKREVFQCLDGNTSALTRPKVLYDGEKYVIWFTMIGGKGEAGIAVSDSIKGPFRFLKTTGVESGGIIGNLNLFRDTDGKAYVIYNVQYMNPASGVYGSRIYCSELKENDYTEFADEPRKTFFSRDYNADTLPEDYGTDFSSSDVGTIFRHENRYYMMNAGENKYAVTDSLDEPWEVKQLLFWDGTSASEIDCKIQSSSMIFTGEGKDLEYIHIGDNGEWTSPEIGRHIWLPIVFMEDEDNPIALKKCSDWKLQGTPSGSEDESADGSKLMEKIKEYEPLKESDHTAASWAGYASVLNDAKILIGQLASAEQKDVDAALEALQAARESLVTLESVLDSALQLYQDVIKSDEYSQDAWNVFQENLREAQIMKTQGGYTESQMKKIIADLKTAYDNLKSGGKTDPDEGKDPEETDPKPDEGKDPEETHPKQIRVTKITVTGTVKKLAKGKKMNLGVSVLPLDAANKKVFWTSSDTKAAEVDANGVVTGKAAGTAVITAFAEDGSGVSGSYTVKVVKHKVKKIIITANKKKVAAGKKVKVNAVIKTSGKTANKTLEWSISNEKYAAVNAKGVVTAKKAGKGKTVTVTAKATDGSGKKDSVKIKIK